MDENNNKPIEKQTYEIDIQTDQVKGKEKGTVFFGIDGKVLILTVDDINEYGDFQPAEER